MTVKQALAHAERVPSKKQLVKNAWIDRDMSWLQFNLRVLNEAIDLTEKFQLAAADVFEVRGLLDYTTLFQIANLDVPELRDTPWTPVAPPRIPNQDTDIFAVLRAGDVLVHHPYESFDLSVEQFIHDAATDPLTMAIKMTVYRVGDDTPFVRSLIRAAEGGKQVACVIELQARFDEASNIHWAKELEKVGAHVTYGVLGLRYQQLREARIRGAARRHSTCGNAFAR